MFGQSQRKYMVKEGNRRVRRQIMSPNVFFTFDEMLGRKEEGEGEVDC
jgi:hypothetical protein